MRVNLKIIFSILFKRSFFSNLHNRPIIKKKEALFKTKLKISNSMRVNLKIIFSILFKKKFFLNSRFLTQNKIFELLTRKFYPVLNHRVKNCKLLTQEILKKIKNSIHKIVESRIQHHNVQLQSRGGNNLNRNRKHTLVELFLGFTCCELHTIKKELSFSLDIVHELEKLGKGDI